MMRTHRCGDLRTEHVGEKVMLCGWVASRRDHGGVVFLDARDAAGLVQVVVDPDAADGDDPHQLRNEYVIRVDGEVRARPEGTVNPDLATGEIEVAATRLEVLNAAEPSPIPLGRVEADEALRLKYRYLDLRRDRMQRNLRLRASVNAAMRVSMVEQGFVELETPMLVASTPEGARDFVVPSRLQQGSFYALPQSPQLFKQLLMVGGFDRYFQIARCLRDEDARADRQYEFMQYDMEMSFADAEDVMTVVTEAVQAAVEAVRGERAPAFRRMTWQESMDRYGVDKPDIRLGVELVDVSECFEATEFRAFQAVEVIKGICLRGEGAMGRGRLDALTERAQNLGAAGLVWMRVQERGGVDSPVAKYLSEAEQLCVVDALGAAAGDLLLLVAGAWRLVDAVLGQLRLELARPGVSEGGLQFVWVVDFPLFEGVAEDGTPIPAHHPFTMPHPDDLELLSSATGVELLEARSLSYDLVVNGWELGSGSVRIHSSDVQQQVFSLLGITPERARERFGFLLDAFRYGAPPHAGFALGTDRFAAVLAEEENIREVIAFPKTQSGADPLTGAPTPLDPAQLAELGLQVRRR
jgi:aspartyl-tRNA synthetase